MAKKASKPSRCYTITPLKSFRKLLHKLLATEIVSASLTSVRTPTPSRSNTTISDLPNNLLIEILLRVPIFGISSCRWVCKNWLNLISDPYFAKLHLKNSSSPNPSMLFSTRNTSTDIIEFGPGKHCNRIGLEPKLGFADDMIVLDSCNGLLLLQHKPSLHLYIHNPILKEHIKVPNMGEDAVLAGVYRLGYSNGTNSFKVIKLIQRSCRVNGAKIYVVGGHENSWRHIENVPPGSWLPSELGFVHGSLHWFLFSGSEPCSICCFDIEKEQFGLLPPPPPLKQFNGSNVKFVRCWVLGGCLYVSFVAGYYQLHLWVMKDYRVERSWSKEFVIKVGDYLASIAGMLPDGKLLLVLDKALHSLDPETGNCEWLMVEMDDLPATKCVPSFISPKRLVMNGSW